MALGLSDIINVSAIDRYSLAVQNDGTVWTWGSNGYGQLGCGSGTPSTNIPVQVFFSDITENPSDAPPNLTAVAGNSKVDLSWDAVADATSYNVKRSITSESPYTEIVNVAETSYTDTDVVNGTTYYYIVTAVFAEGESADSNEASAMPQASSGEQAKRFLS